MMFLVFVFTGEETSKTSQSTQTGKINIFDTHFY
jgi:hypothetical protein